MNGDYLVDASVLIQAYVQEAQTDAALTLIAGLEEPAAYSVHIPEFCLLECTNILWKHVQFQGMPISQAEKAIHHLVELPLIVHLASPHLSTALAMGLTHQLALYDSLYLALAKDANLSLITADSKQAQAARVEEITLTRLQDLVQ